MRRALPASLVLHLGALGGAYLLFVGAAPDDPNGVESMTVDLIPIVATTNVTPDEAEVEATTAQVSAGADEVAIAEAEPVETLEAEAVDAPVLRRLDGVEAETPEEPPRADALPVEAEPVERIELAAASRPPRAAVEAGPAVPTPAAEAPTVEPERPLPEAMTAEPVGSTPVEADMPAPIEALEPRVEPEALPQPQPVEATELAEATPARPAEPLEAVEPAEPVEPIEVALAEPPVPEVALPEAIEEVELPPVPRPKTVKQSDVPTYPEENAAEKKQPPRKTKAADKPAEKAGKADKPAPKTEKVANLGNGGKNQADTAAGKASGGKGKTAEPGSAEISTYEGLVRRHLGRKSKMSKVGRGTVLVSFVIGKGGNVKSVSVARSSGNAKLDSAAIATVKRAAPYPPIPDEFGKSSWSFNIPMDGDR